jgi:GTP-binding protein LepA
MKTGEILEIDSPAEFPSQEKIKTLEEPHIRATIITPQEYLGPIFKLLEKRRGKFLDMDWLDNIRVRLSHHIPLGEVAMGFHDQLKSVSQGYASFDYDHSGYQEADLIKLEILVNGKSLPSLSSVVHRETAYLKGKNLISRLKMVIPRQLFPIPLQAVAGKRIIARETIPALRKDVTAPLYGGDITRKRKLLDRQKKGKKRMRKFGEVSIPQEAFLIFLETG